MQTNVRKLRKHRRFTEDFKKSIVTEFESGTLSVLELSRIHYISYALIYKWIYKFSKFNSKGYRIIEMKDSTSKKLKDLEKKVKELERTVGQKQIKIDYLEKMMEIAQEEYNIDIKKNSDTLQSDGSGKTKNN